MSLRATARALPTRAKIGFAEEGADLFYHALFALHAVGADLGAVRDVLARRAAQGAPPR